MCDREPLSGDRMPTRHLHPFTLLLTLTVACGDPGGGDTDGSGSDPGSSGTGGPGATQDGTSSQDAPTSGSDSGTSTGGDPTTADPTTGAPDPTDTDDPPSGHPRCGDAPPPDAVLAPEIPAYEGACPIIETGFMDGQPPNFLPQQVGPNMYQRSFLVIVPEDMTPDERLPVMFMWHWLGGSAQDFYERAAAQDAVDRLRFIAVIPNGRDTDQGTLFKWPFSIADADESMQAEFKFFDDMLACVHEQFNVDKDCVSSVGVSAGALFTSQLLAGGRGDRLASFLSLSGGTGGAFVKPWTPPAHKMPALVLWGGPNDFCVAVDFEQTSQDLEQKLVEGGHFVTECIHNCNHSTPPFEVPEGMTPFAPLWDFMFDHPYWLRPGESPYNEIGLPPSMPAWCAVGVGNAVPPAEPCDKNECS
jgi:predicted esterase